MTLATRTIGVPGVPAPSPLLALAGRDRAPAPDPARLGAMAVPVRVGAALEAGPARLAMGWGLGPSSFARATARRRKEPIVGITPRLARCPARRRDERPALGAACADGSPTNAGARFARVQTAVPRAAAAALAAHAAAHRAPTGRRAQRMARAA